MDIADPTDWTETTLPSLIALDSLLRCTICKDFFSNAVITNCAHTFCSICIRRALDLDGACPTCRAPEQQPRLRRNVAIQEATDAFKTSRPDILQIARQQPTDAFEQDPPALKRKRGQGESPVTVEEPPLDKRTRRQPRRAATQKTPTPSQDTEFDTFALDDSRYDKQDADFEPEPNDGLVPCPMCQKRMKEDLVFSHLDRCEDEQRQIKRIPPLPLQGKPSTSLEKLLERLPQLNYNLMKESALRTKLRELGISSSGGKALLQKRHTEWINIWNANSDSSRPRSKKELLGDLDAWERSYMRGGTVESSKLMQKDFDGMQWARDNKVDFQDLIARARAGAGKRARQAAGASAQTGSDGMAVTDSPASGGGNAAGDDQASRPHSAEAAIVDTIDSHSSSSRRNSAVADSLLQKQDSPSVMGPPERRLSSLPEILASPTRDAAVTRRPMFEMPQDLRSD